jgi:Flp pilus assembly CpaE family ATPase
MGKHLASNDLLNGMQAPSACGVVAIEERLAAKGGVDQLTLAHHLLPQVADEFSCGRVVIGFTGGHH